MPIIAIVLSGVVSGPFLWLTRGGGLEQIDQLLRERRDRKRRQKALEQQSLAPLRALKDPRDAAAVLMVAVAEARGVMSRSRKPWCRSGWAACSALPTRKSAPGSSIPATRRGRRPRSTPLSRTSQNSSTRSSRAPRAASARPTSRRGRSRSPPAASPRPPDLAASAVGGDAGIGQPHGLRRLAGLPEYVDRHAAAGIPVAADAQIPGLEQLCQALADRDGAILV